MSVPTSLCFSLNGNELISGGRDKVLNFWDLKKFDLIRTIPVYETIESVLLAPAPLRQLLKGNSKGNLVIVAGEKGILRVFDTETATCVLTEESTGLSLQFERLLYIFLPFDIFFHFN